MINNSSVTHVQNLSFNFCSSVLLVIYLMLFAQLDCKLLENMNQVFFFFSSVYSTVPNMVYWT